MVRCTNGYISTTRRRHRLLDSVLREYGIVTPCGDEERARSYHCQYCAVVAIISETRHEQGVVVVDPVALERAQTAEAATRDGGANAGINGGGNRVSWPPSEWPIMPRREASTSGRVSR